MSSGCVALVVYSVATFLAFYSVSCGLSKSILQQIESSRVGVNQIKQLVLSGDRRHKTYTRLAELGDKFPNRLSGSDALEHSIDYILDEMQKEGFDNVHGEDVTVPKWTRGKEYGAILTPLERPMAVMALGTSIGTNGVNLTGEVIVVKSFEELEQKKSRIRGKIVVYNQKWNGYRQTVLYRLRGATEAAKWGAKAALIRSITDFSIYSLHTGAQTYDAEVAEIPAACITVEDAELLQRYFDRGASVTVLLYSEAQNHPPVRSRNIVAEIRGSTYPEQVVIFGGHVDTWDVGTGSMDDGGGLMISWEALSVIKQLQLKPKRTLRVVLWTAEEIDLTGGLAYYNAHKQESDNVSIIMESDHGVFNPKGLQFSGSGYARAIMEEILKMVNDINASTVLEGGGNSSDTGWWVTEKNVPGAELYSANENYFYFHHTHGDTMTVLDKDQLDRATILWATTVYSVANLDQVLPRTGGYPRMSKSIRLTPSIRLSLSAAAAVIIMSGMKIAK